MKMTLWILKVLLVLQIFTQISLSKSIKQDIGKVRCEASAVHMGGEGQIICYYPTDLNKHPYEVNVVVKHSVNDSDRHILDCFWYDMHLCTAFREGYKMTSFTGNTLTVTINKVTDEHKGQYRCLLADKYTVHDFEFCDFVVKGSDEGGLSVEAVSAMVIGVLLSTVIVVVVVVVCVVWHRRQRIAMLIGIRDFKGHVPTVNKLDSALMDTQTRSGAATHNPADITERNDPSTDRSLTDQSEGAEEGAEVKEDETNEITTTLESPLDALQLDSLLKQDMDKEAEEEERKELKEEEEDEEKESLLDSSEHSATHIHTNPNRQGRDSSY